VLLVSRLNCYVMFVRKISDVRLKRARCEILLMKLDYWLLRHTYKVLLTSLRVRIFHQGRGDIPRLGQKSHV
jgi:hypothetical protein